MRGLSSVAILIILLLISGCASPSLPVADPVDAYYKSSPNPPPGYARLYILSDPKAEKTLVYFGRTKGDAKRIGVLPQGDYFIAFDVPGGNYYLAMGPVGGMYTSSAESFDLDEGTTKIIRPIMYFHGIGMLDIIMYDLSYMGKPRFEMIDPAFGMNAIQHEKMLGISSEAPQYVKQQIPASTILPAARPLSP